MAVGERGKVAVVIGVGASAGTGAALCRRFAREGLHTFVAGRTQAKIDAIVDEISQSGGTATSVVTDTTRTQDVCALFDRVAESATGLEQAVAFGVGQREVELRDVAEECGLGAVRVQVGCVALQDLRARDPRLRGLEPPQS